MADPYLQDDGRTLRNKLGIVGDPDALQKAETLRVDFRSAQLKAENLPNAQGFELIKAVHQHLFQDVYEWAGKARITPLAKLHVEGEAGRTAFTRPDRIEQDAARVFSKLTAENGLRGLAPADFAKQLAPRVSELNAVHPFREGNGRTQRIVWEHVAKQAGHDLSFEGISRERMISASIAGSRGDHEPVRRMLGELLDPERREALVTATRFLENARLKGGSLEWNDRYVSTTTPGQTYKGLYAGAGGNNFILGDGDRIYIGKLADLPERGLGLTVGTKIEFQAGAKPTANAQQNPDTAARDYWTRTTAKAPQPSPTGPTQAENSTPKRQQKPPKA